MRPRCRRARESRCPRLELAAETFRHHKVDLAAQGADPRKVTDPLFQFDRASQLYRPLTASDYVRLLAGDARL